MISDTKNHKQCTFMKFHKLLLLFYSLSNCMFKWLQRISWGWPQGRSELLEVGRGSFRRGKQRLEPRRRGWFWSVSDSSFANRRDMLVDVVVETPQGGTSSSKVGSKETVVDLSITEWAPAERMPQVRTRKCDLLVCVAPCLCMLATPMFCMLASPV